MTIAGHEPPADVCVVGASAGGVEALQAFVRGLPQGHAGVVLVVLHVAAHGTSVLPAILTRAGPLPAAFAIDGEALLPARVIVAPPDVHLAVRDGRVALVAEPREHGHRPAVDVLFRSAAAAYGRRAVGVLLSGSGSDGTAGLTAILAAGGRALAQDPAQARFAAMPASAIARAAVDLVAPVEELARAVAHLAAGRAGPRGRRPPTSPGGLGCSGQPSSAARRAGPRSVNP